MNFQVISLLPEMILAGLKEGVVATSIDNKIISVECLNPRKFTTDVHHTVDDRPFGGGDGMVLMPEPIDQSIRHLRAKAEEPCEIIYLSARGEPLTDQLARSLGAKKNLILICGRYGGIDQRVLAQHKVREISIGDYILSGGELAALVLIDSVARHLPGVLGNNTSADNDSFSNGLLEAPSFTRTRDWNSHEVPAVLLSGDHKKIKEWRHFLSVLSTIQTREDLFWKKNFTRKELEETKNFFNKMPDQEKWMCGLVSTQILRVLDEALKGHT